METGHKRVVSSVSRNAPGPCRALHAASEEQGISSSTGRRASTTCEAKSGGSAGEADRSAEGSGERRERPRNRRSHSKDIWARAERAGDKGVQGIASRTAGQ